jgi:two-component system, OmpR family, sensor histidine kinase MtrB
LSSEPLYSSSQKRESIGLGLRGRLIAAFAAGALLLSLVMGAIAYYTTRHFLITDRQQAAVHQAYANAALLRNDLAANVPHIDSALTSLDSGPGSASLLESKGQWFSTSLAINRTSLTPSLRAAVRNLKVATQTSRINASPAFGVGIPLPAVSSSYFLVYELSDLEQTLRVVLAALGAAAAFTTLLGAVLGLAISRRTVKPLTDVSNAAVAIARGDLDTRLSVRTSDRDLSGLTTSFNEMVDQLQERLERDARFASNVSHELRSPLTTLAASLDVLEARRDQLDPPGQLALDLLAGDLRRFERLVQDLLEISREDAGANDLNLEVVGVEQLITRSVDAALRLNPDLGHPQIHLDPRLHDALVFVDKRRVERVVQNLFENAGYYAGGVTDVEVAPSDAVGYVAISVKDQGPGVADEERDKIFDRFYRGSVAGQRGASEGSGLGLALVAQHVQRHGGHVSVASERGTLGATFTFTLPLANEEDE